MSAGISVRVESNGEQTIVALDGDRVGGVIAIDQDVDVAEAADLVDSIEAEVSQTVGGIGGRRRALEKVIRGSSRGSSA